MRILLLALLLIGCSAVTEPPIPAIESMTVYQGVVNGYNTVTITADITAGCRVWVSVDMPAYNWGNFQQFEFGAANRVLAAFSIPAGYTGEAVCMVRIIEPNVEETQTVIIE